MNDKLKVLLFSSFNKKDIEKIKEKSSNIQIENFQSYDSNDTSTFLSLKSNKSNGNLSQEEINKLIIEKLKEITPQENNEQVTPPFYEINQVALTSSSYGTWMIQNKVISNSNLLLTTPYDPRFYLLPFLYKERQYFQSLDQIMQSNKLYQKTFTLNDALLKFQLDKICDIKNQNSDDPINFDPSLVLFKFNEEKFLNFIKEKVEKVKKVIKKINSRITIINDSFLNLPTKQSENEEDSEEILYKTLEIILDYLPSELQEIVCKEYSYTLSEFYSKKRKQESTTTSDEKIVKKTNIIDNKNENNDTKSNFLTEFMNENTISQIPPKIVKIDKKTEAAAKGTKKIAGFFIKK